MNVKNMKRLIEVMKNAGDNYDQSMWARSCGTPACIGGHAAVEAGAEIVSVPAGGGLSVRTWAEMGGNHRSFTSIARNWLDLTDRQASELMIANPPGFARRKPTTHDAVAVLEHLLATGTVDWSAGTRTA